MRVFACIAVAICSITGTAHAFDTWWHAECTRKAMESTGFSGDARLVVQVENYLTDVFPAFGVVNEKLDKEGLSKLHLKADNSYDYMHFDAVFTTADITANWDKLEKNTVAALQKYAKDPDVKPGFRLIVLYSILGASLHTVQDFYSHSNWVNHYSEGHTSPIPIWFDVAASDRDKLDLFSGAYPDGSSKGHKDHGELNKDSSARALNMAAVEVATRASTDWTQRIMKATPDVPWSELQAYTIQKNVVMKRFLSTLDATFLTSSSIIAGHFDGDTAVKQVFAPGDLARETRMAITAFGILLPDYLTNMGTKGNVFGLPTPYWAGHMGYHITHAIADGLLLDGKVYHAK